MCDATREAPDVGRPRAFKQTHWQSASPQPCKTATGTGQPATAPGPALARYGMRPAQDKFSGLCQKKLEEISCFLGFLSCLRPLVSPTPHATHTAPRSERRMYQFFLAPDLPVSPLSISGLRKLNVDTCMIRCTSNSQLLLQGGNHRSI